MATQPEPSSSGTTAIEIASFVHGVHACKDLWEPREGEILLLKCKPENLQDKFPVAIMRNGTVVGGHVPKSWAPVFSQFLKRSYNKGMVQVTGMRMN